MSLGPAYGVGVGGAASPEFIEIGHSSAVQDMTITSSNANYEWTGVNTESTAANFTLDGSDELTVNLAGTYQINWSLFLGWSAGTTTPFWILSFLEIDVGGVGSWAFINGSQSAGGLGDDPGGGQSKINISGSMIVTLAATDKLRLRLRRGAGAATTLKTDGGSGSTWSLIKLKD